MACPRGCCSTYREHLLSVGIAPSATPSRAGGARAAEINATEKRWDKDHRAYRNLVRDGIQPETLDGCAALERDATSRVEIERGRLMSPTERSVLSDLGGAA